MLPLWSWPYKRVTDETLELAPGTIVSLGRCEFLVLDGWACIELGSGLEWAFVLIETLPFDTIEDFLCRPWCFFCSLIYYFPAP